MYDIIIMKKTLLPIELLIFRLSLYGTKFLLHYMRYDLKGTMPEKENIKA